MNFDDDAPPDLVEASIDLSEDDKPVVKVPITIVTGMFNYLRKCNSDTDTTVQDTWVLGRRLS